MLCSGLRLVRDPAGSVLYQCDRTTLSPCGKWWARWESEKIRSSGVLPRYWNSGWRPELVPPLGAVIGSRPVTSEVLQRLAIGLIGDRQEARYVYVPVFVQVYKDWSSAVAVLGSPRWAMFDAVDRVRAPDWILEILCDAIEYRVLSRKGTVLGFAERPTWVLCLDRFPEIYGRPALLGPEGAPVNAINL